MVRSMCCRLQLDLRELLKRGNGLFGSAEQTGSVGVVTVNCARLGYLHAGDEPALLAALDRLSEGQARLAAMAEAAPAAAPDAALPRVLNRLADGQSRLVELAEARVVTPDDPEVRMRLRSIDELLGRLVEESASGRDGLISELREDMAALTRAIRNLERGDGA